MAGAKQLGDHTLVIPTYNRPELLERLLAYYAAYCAEMQILVLDSSTPDTVRRNAEMIRRRAPNAAHATYPASMPMAKKLAEGLGKVGTPTVSFCADDDIVFPAALAPAVEFLDANPDYVTAHGVYLNFREDNQNVHLSVEYSGPGIEASHPGARIFRLMQSYESLFYGVFRTPDLRDIFAEAGKIPTLHYQELMQSVAALIKGKVRRFGTFYAARRSGPEAEPGRDRWQTYYWFADDAGEFITHYANYREQAWHFYKAQYPRSHAHALEHAEFVRMMDMSHMVYFSRNCPPLYFHDRLEHLWPKDRLTENFRGLGRRLPFRAEWIMRNMVRYRNGLKRRMTGAQPSRLRPLFALHALWSERHARRLTRKMAGVTEKTWIATFSPGWNWLARKPGFPDVYRELCRYLDGPTR